MSAVPKIYVSQRSELRERNFNDIGSCCLIQLDKPEKQIRIRPLDVSRRGLGFLVNEKLESGNIYQLCLGNDKFLIEVAYCNTHLGIDNLFRCGLFLREEKGDLHATCLRLGMIENNSQSED